MGFPILTIAAFASLIIGYFMRNDIIFLMGLLLVFIAMSMMARGEAI